MATLTLPRRIAPRLNVRGAWAVAPIAVLLAYYFQNELAARITTSLWGTYYLVPAVWLLAAGAAYLAATETSDSATADRPPVDVSLGVIAGLVALFHIALLVMGGVVAGFGHSPYAQTPVWVWRNVLFFGAPLLAIEMTRWALLRRFSGTSLTLALLLAAVGSTALSLSVAQFQQLALDSNTLFLTGRAVLPTLAGGVLAGFLCYLAGPRPALIYRGAVTAFWVFSPVLPGLEWIVLGFVGVAAPALGLWVVEGLVSEESATEDAGYGISPAWLVTSVLALAIFFFSFGFFGVKPSFVPTHSMEPKINSGDIVFTRKVDPASVKVGDIVRYRHGNMEVLHRIIAINPDGTLSTKGDNNNTPDPEPVYREQIVGKYVGHIPKLGWVPIKVGEFLGALR